MWHIGFCVKPGLKPAPVVVRGEGGGVEISHILLIKG